ncbi:hypothetical protein H9651_07605 [Microbacterium sp. Sa4CUA7]|uniref:Transcriptional regulator, AbiEi antitoxin, Type IV TA system n=1 Tax=Microbacterium pullorum TaxID=2762236 RepID=A0ABR8S1Z2_9MICO|nr:hypothetical protein [Microbacterium pullorum]MBD7957501.1 hypothetical protein [Microbacterium pullorum]
MTLEIAPADLPAPEEFIREQARMEVRQRLARGTLVRLHGQWELTADEYACLYAEEQHRIDVTRVARAMRTDAAVVSYASAAAVHGLPLFRARPRRVHVTMRAGAATRSHPAVFRHRDSLPEEDVASVGGVAVTSLERTVIDAIRVLRLEAAVAVADAALHRVAWDDAARRYDGQAAERMRLRLWQRLFRMPGARGIRQARWVLELADGRADGPGESVGRLYLLLLGFARPRLQVAVPGPDGGVYRMDAALDDVGFWWEFDGVGKYVDTEMTGGREPGDILRRQRRREEWVTATTGWSFTRCRWTHLESLTVFALKLRADGVPLPRAHVLPL